MRKIVFIFAVFVTASFMSCGNKTESSTVPDSVDTTVNYLDSAELQGFDVTIDSLIDAGVAIGDTDEGV